VDGRRHGLDANDLDGAHDFDGADTHDLDGAGTHDNALARCAARARDRETDEEETRNE
jgi:hypothetical protein